MKFLVIQYLAIIFLKSCHLLLAEFPSAFITAQSASRKIINGRNADHLLISFISLKCFQSKWKWKNTPHFPATCYKDEIGHLSRVCMCIRVSVTNKWAQALACCILCLLLSTHFWWAACYILHLDAKTSVVTHTDMHVTDYSWFKDTKRPFCFTSVGCSIHERRKSRDDSS